MGKGLTDSEITEQLKNLKGWAHVGENIERNFEFKDFEKALKFVNQVGAEAQKLDHHPDMLLHDWNQVKVSASTHTENAITDKDIELARHANAIEN